jgi:hypothetical protein
MGEVSNEVSQQMYAAVREGRVSEARQLLSLHPELRTTGGIFPTWLHDASSAGHVEMVRMMTDEGFDVNARGKNRPDGPLSCTLEDGHVAAARLLLDHGASPHVGRLLIGALNCDDPGISFELVKRLVEHGVDVNQCWRFGDEEHGPLFNALSWAIDGEREEIAGYLRAHGATLPPQG